MTRGAECGSCVGRAWHRQEEHTADTVQHNRLASMHALARLTVRGRRTRAVDPSCWTQHSRPLHQVWRTRTLNSPRHSLRDSGRCGAAATMASPPEKGGVMAHRPSLHRLHHGGCHLPHRVRQLQTQLQRPLYPHHLCRVSSLRAAQCWCEALAGCRRGCKCYGPPVLPGIASLRPCHQSGQPTHGQRNDTKLGYVHTSCPSSSSNRPDCMILLDSEAAASASSRDASIAAATAAA